MNSYLLSPYVHIIENCVFPGAADYAVFHQCTGELFEPSDRVRSLLFAVKLGHRISFSEEDLNSLGPDGSHIRQLIGKEFLVSEGHDAMTSFLNWYVVRPIQNPAVAYCPPGEEMVLVRTSMAQRVFSPAMGELPGIIEESLDRLAAEIFLAADGTITLAEIGKKLLPRSANPLTDRDFREAIEFLTRPHRQLIKFAAESADRHDPYSPCNVVPRNMYRTLTSPRNSQLASDFHLQGIHDAAWEFDFIEPTINHCFRFPSEALGGLDYGARFCVSMMVEVLPSLGKTDRLEVLEVGGGTGTFARSFIEQARALGAGVLNGVEVNYQIVDLSPVLIESQRNRLSSIAPAVQHFQQDATELDIPGRTFDLIIANEVVADFPVAPVTRQVNDESGDTSREWEGAGAHYLKKYDLASEAAADSFLVNAGAFRFIERAWEHLKPGGTLVVTEYGGESAYPIEAYHLNHEEFSIHFGHLRQCAERVGFNCRLYPLKEFLGIDDQTLMLDGHDEHLLCLNHIFAKYGQSIPFALISEREFRGNFQELCERVSLTGISFSPLSNGFHFGPQLDQFMLLMMTKPE